MRPAARGRGSALLALAACAVVAACGDRASVSDVPSPEWDLVFFSDRSGAGDLFLISAEDFRTGSFTPALLVGTGYPDYNPRWVPQGPGLVFVTDVEEPSALYGIGPDSEGMAQRIRENPALDEPPAYAPDGEHLVYVAAVDGGWDLFRSDFAGGEPLRLTTDGVRKGQPAISPDGEWVAFVEAGDGAQDLMLMRLDGSERRNLTDGPSNDGHPYWLPDGSGLLFDSSRTGVGTDIFHLDLESGVLRNLTNDPGIDLVATVSPDGEWVAFGSSRFGSWDIFIVPFEGGAARQVTADPSFEGDPHWVPAGAFRVEVGTGGP